MFFTRGFSYSKKGQVSLEFMILAAALMFMLGILLPSYHSLLDAQSSLQKVQVGSYYADSLRETIRVLSFSPSGTTRRMSDYSVDYFSLTANDHSLFLKVFLPDGINQKEFSIPSTLPLVDNRDTNSPLFLVRRDTFISLES